MSYYGSNFANNSSNNNAKGSGGGSGATGGSNNGGFYQASANSGSGGYDNWGGGNSGANNSNAYATDDSSSQNQYSQWQGTAASNNPAAASTTHSIFTPMPQQQQSSSSTFTAAANPFWLAAASSATGGGMTNDAMLDLAGTAGQAFLQSGWARMIPGFEAGMTLLRNYFAVDNNYVLRKMLKILFPYTNKNWERSKKEVRLDIPPVYDIPRIDENAPDLYIPSMSLITYVLLCAVVYGTAGQFNPEVIPDVTTQCFVVQLLEVAAIRFGFYMMQVPVAMLDLMCYTGYKYFGLCLNMLLGILAQYATGTRGTRGYWIVFAWTASAAVFFMFKTIGCCLPKQTLASGPKREVMVLAFALSQVFTMWCVSKTQYL